jgi:hypothetical protein
VSYIFNLRESSPISGAGGTMFDQAAFHHFKGTTVKDILDRQHLDIEEKHLNLRSAIIEGQ